MVILGRIEVFQRKNLRYDGFGQFSLRFFPNLWVDPVFYLQWINEIKNVIGLEIFLTALAGLLVFPEKRWRGMLVGLVAGYPHPRASGYFLVAFTMIQSATLLLEEPYKVTPLSFPLLVARMQGRLSSEKLADRVRRMQLKLEKAVNKPKESKKH